jgi:AraC family transcriptional regulator of adaptative response/methylated-DNA-[protein]-cysteine methyltransferase
MIRRNTMKPQLRDLLANGHFDEIAEVAGRNRRVLGLLTSLTYDPDPLIAWRAVEASGLVSTRIAQDDPEFVRDHLRRLFWLLTDESGGIAWRAPEAIGEIIRSRPHELSSFIPMLLALLEMEPEDLVRFQAGTLWAIGRLAEVLPDAIGPVIPQLLSTLRNPDSQIRGLAVWCLGKLRKAGRLSSDHALHAQDGPVDLYVGGQIIRTSVAELMRDLQEKAKG